MQYKINYINKCIYIIFINKINLYLPIKFILLPISTEQKTTLGILYLWGCFITHRAA